MTNNATQLPITCYEPPPEGISRLGHAVGRQQGTRILVGTEHLMGSGNAPGALAEIGPSAAPSSALKPT